MLEQLPCACVDQVPLRRPSISEKMEQKSTGLELKRQACQSLQQVLQLKLQQRRSREKLVKQGIMPLLKSSAVSYEQRRSLERARNEDYRKRKIISQPERSELIKMHILEESSARPSPQAKQLQLKRVHLADNLNKKVSCRLGPMELVHKNILPLHSGFKQAIKKTQFPKISDESCDDSNCSLSPELNQDSPSPPVILARSSIPSPPMVPRPDHPFTPVPGPSSLKLTNGMAGPSAQRMGALSQIKHQPEPNSDHSVKRHKKLKDNKPKIKKLKYHQYIPPHEKRDKDPPSHLDASYTKVLRQQQLLLQFQILNQQQNCNYPAILTAPSMAQTEQQTPSSSSSNSVMACSTPPPGIAPAVTRSKQSCQSSSPLGGTKPPSLPPNVDGMKAAELKSELKLRSLTASSTKNSLIERLRNYQKPNGGCGTTSSPTAGGTAEPGVEGADQSSKTTVTTTDNKSEHLQDLCPCHQTSSLTADAMSSTATAADTQQPMTSNGTVSPPALSLPHSDCTSGTMSLEDTSVNSDPLGEMPSHQLRPTTRLQIKIKKEPKCSTLTPCQFSLKMAPLQKHCQVSSPAHSTTTTTPVVTVDTDKMLREKDRKIEELTRMLMQKQRLVEVLSMQLEHGKCGDVPETLCVKMKQDPSNLSRMPLSFGHSPLHHLPSCEKEAQVKVKEESIEVEVEAKTPPALLQATQTQAVQLESDQQSMQSKEQHICLEKTNLHCSQQQAIRQLLLQKQCKNQKKQRKIQISNKLLENLQNLQNRSAKEQKKKPQKQQMKQEILQQNKQHHWTKQQHQQISQTHAMIQLKQQQVLIQQKQEMQQEAPQAYQMYLHQHPVPVFPLKSNATPIVVTDSNGNYFLIALTSHSTERQRTNDMPESKAADQVTLQTPNAAFEDCVDQDISQRLSAPASLQPFLKDPETAPSGTLTLSPSSQLGETGLDVLFGSLAPVSLTAAASSPDNNATEHEDYFIDVQTGGLLISKPVTDPFLDHQNPDISPPPYPLQQLLTPPTSANCDTPQLTPSMQSEHETVVDTTEEEKHHLSGHLGAILESTTRKPVLGVEPGGLLTLIDELHNQILCTPSILDCPPSPIDTYNVAVEGEYELDRMDWLDLTMGKVKGEETSAQGLLAPQTPSSTFSTDFLDNFDLQTHWDI